MENDSTNSLPVDATRPHTVPRSLVHDLRNAVAPICNAVQLLRFRGGAYPDLGPVTDIIERQVNEIVRMLNLFADADHNGRGDRPAAAGGSDREAPSSAAGATGRQILIVDDNEALLTSLSGVLQEAGHAVTTAASGVEALALAQKCKPEFVLLDVQMPRMNGYAVARQLRALFPQGAMKLVMMSGSVLDETTVRGAQRAGFDHCIDKTRDFSALEKLLRSGG